MKNARHEDFFVFAGFIALPLSHLVRCLLAEESCRLEDENHDQQDKRKCVRKRCNTDLFRNTSIHYQNGIQTFDKAFRPGIAPDVGTTPG